jgi:hypothetical protein
MATEAKQGLELDAYLRLYLPAAATIHVHSSSAKQASCY